MAIRILSSREQIKNQFQEMPEEVLRQTIELKIKADGTVVNSDGSTLEFIELGNYGEDWATMIHFDLSELYQQGRLGNEVTDDVKLYERYEPKIHFKHVITAATEETEEEVYINNVDFNGVFFAVPEALTMYVGEYELVYTLKERRGWLDNIAQKKEFFVSSVFKGNVKESLFDYYEWAPILDSVFVQHQTLKKPSIEIGFDDKKRPIIEENGGQRLGYECDRYITDISVKASSNVLESAILYVINGSPLVVNCDANHKAWVPEEVTQHAGLYKMMICMWSENGGVFFSDTFEMEVVENFLNKEEYWTSSENEGNVILDSSGKVIYVLRTKTEE